MPGETFGVDDALLAINREFERVRAILRDDDEVDYSACSARKALIALYHENYQMALRLVGMAVGLDTRWSAYQRLVTDYAADKAA